MRIGFAEVMDVKRGWTCALCGLGIFVLILDSPTALSGAAEGVDLCLKTLIPGLFPFFVLSGLLTSALPGGGLVLAGILGGYPVGARNAAQAWQSGQLSRDDAERMTVLYNCPGPAFIFGVAGQMFSVRETSVLWAIYLTSVGALWFLLPKAKPSSKAPKSLTLPESVHRSLGAMASVCGWVVLMRTVLAVLERWVLWLLPTWGRAAVCGALELTNGMLMLAGVEEKLRFVLAAGMLGFGGICVAMQTLGVTRGLSFQRYFPGKILQCCICTALSSLYTKIPLPLFAWAALAVLGPGCALKLRKIENCYGNLRLVGV